MMLLQHAEGEKVDIGGMVMHHAADANSLDFDPFFKIDLPRWEPIHLGPLTLDISPTKHVVFMLLAAVLVFLVMKLAAIGLEKQRKTGKAPRGFAGVIEGAVLWVRNDIAIANIGHGGEKFAPLIMTLFFFILFANLLGMLPWGASPTANLAVTAGLAVIVFLVIEIAGARKLGFKGYMGTIFPHFPGLHGPGAVVLSVVMSPMRSLPEPPKRLLQRCSPLGPSFATAMSQIPLLVRGPPPKSTLPSNSAATITLPAPSKARR